MLRRGRSRIASMPLPRIRQARRGGRRGSVLRPRGSRDLRVRRPHRLARAAGVWCSRLGGGGAALRALCARSSVRCTRRRRRPFRERFVADGIVRGPAEPDPRDRPRERARVVQPGVQTSRDVRRQRRRLYARPSASRSAPRRQPRRELGQHCLKHGFVQPRHRQVVGRDLDSAERRSATTGPTCSAW